MNTPAPDTDALDATLARLRRAAVQGSAMTPRRRALAYALTLGLALAVIWTPVALYISLAPPNYVSRWSLLLPGSASGHAVSLDSVGQANATVSSPYASHSVSPKASVKAIAESTPVREAAARALGMSVKEFGTPRYRLVDQTTLMEIQIGSDDPQMAQAKAEVLHQSLLAELDRLRADEAARREETTQRLLAGFSDKLERAQADVRDHQSRSRVISSEQLQEITLGLERLHNERVLLTAERAALEAELDALVQALNVGAGAAGALLMLRGDAQLQTLLRLRAEAAGAVSEAAARWGDRHPRVVSARSALERHQRAVMKRLGALVDVPEDAAERWLVAASGVGGPLDRLDQVHGRVAGAGRRLATLEAGIAEQQQLLEVATRDVAELEDLTRTQQVATAVFTTALAKLDIGKSDPYAAYPLVQLLAAPTLPLEPERLAAQLAIGGAALASLFCLLGMVLLWIRKPLLRRLLKSA